MQTDGDKIVVLVKLPSDGYITALGRLGYTPKFVSAVETVLLLDKLGEIVTTRYSGVIITSARAVDAWKSVSGTGGTYLVLKREDGLTAHRLVVDTILCCRPGNSNSTPLN